MNLDNIFLQHRTCYEFDDKPIPQDILKEIYDVSKYGATSFNCLPLRIVFITSKEQKAKLLECILAGNVEKTKSAPVTAIFAYDTNFYTKLDKLFPYMPNVANFFINNNDLIEETAFRNSSLQTAYFMVVAKSKGIACGPMSGFNKDMVNDKFLKDSNWKVNFLCNLGYKKNATETDGPPRLEFDEASKFI
jgi:3-hydroxypropanoate dehydrogenase